MQHIPEQRPRKPIANSTKGSFKSTSPPNILTITSSSLAGETVGLGVDAKVGVSEGDDVGEKVT